jgi:hypothetical protein
MNRKLKIAALVCSAASACAGLGREARHQATERLDERGVETRALAVESGGALTFGRGRDGPFEPPPARIRTGGFPASGSCLRS